MKKLSLYIHIPFCVRKCAYCDFNSGAYDLRMHEAYVKALIEEIKYMGAQLRQHAVASVFVGGGTPTWLSVDLMEEIFAVLKSSFNFISEPEITIECNPGTVTAEAFARYRAMGFNRLSIGLQSANEDELKLLGRIHNYQHFLRTFDMARKAGFWDVNVDIMTGLPYQTPEKLLHTLQQVTYLKPEHISAYSLIVEPGTPFYEAYWDDLARQKNGKPTEHLPDENAEYALTKLTQKFLAEKGYGQYEISNFAREGYECYHNQVYWTRGEYLGLGLGAASLLGHERFSNLKDIYAYIEAGPDKRDAESVIELSKKDEMEEFMYLGLRRNAGVSRDDFADAFGCDIESVYGSVIEKLVSEELLVYTAGQVYLTEKGMDLSNYALAEFLLG